MLPGSSPSKRTRPERDNDSDTDFQDDKVATEAEDTGNESDVVDVKELESSEKPRISRSQLTDHARPPKGTSADTSPFIKYHLTDL